MISVTSCSPWCSTDSNSQHQIHTQWTAATCMNTLVANPFHRSGPPASVRRRLDFVNRRNCGSHWPTTGRSTGTARQGRSVSFRATRRDSDRGGGAVSNRCVAFGSGARARMDRAPAGISGAVVVNWCRPRQGRVCEIYLCCPLCASEANKPIDGADGRAEWRKRKKTRGNGDVGWPDGDETRAAKQKRMGSSIRASRLQHGTKNRARSLWAVLNYLICKIIINIV